MTIASARFEKLEKAPSPDFPLVCKRAAALVTSPGDAKAASIDGRVSSEPQSQLTPEQKLISELNPTSLPNTSVDHTWTQWPGPTWPSNTELDSDSPLNRNPDSHLTLAPNHP